MNATKPATRPTRLTVADVMTTSVVTAAEAATFHELSALMSHHGVSAIPIGDLDGRIIGIVSETDLLPKAALPASHVWPPHSRRTERAQAQGITAGDVMSAPPVTAGPSERLGVAVRRMLDHHVNQLPVLEPDGRLVGILSRHDALRAFQRDDDEIRLDIVDGVLPHWMGMTPDSVDVSVAGGVVLLRGGLERRSDVKTLGHLINGLDGVVAVDDELKWAVDDSHAQPLAELGVG